MYAIRSYYAHNEKKFKGSSTSFASDWELFYTLECPNRSVALKIESHIKKNRNRTYYSNLAKYSEIGERLLRLYHLGSRHVLDNRFCLMHICR